MNSKLFAVCLNVIIFTIAFNAPIIMQSYLDYQIIGGDALVSTVINIIFALAFVFPIIYVCSASSYLLIIIYLISGLSAYFIYRFNIQIDLEMIASFFESSSGEVMNFLNLEFIYALLYSGLLGVIAMFSIARSSITKDKNKRVNFICLVFVIGCLFGDSELMANFLPYNVLKQTGIYWLEKASLLKKRIDIAKNYQYELNKKSENLNIVLIIGESARVDHFSLSGYKRNTNPWLKQEKNLIYYPYVTACYPLTRVAVPCMITRATRSDRSISSQETSFIGIFKKLGFYTSWFGMQGTFTAIDAPYLDLAKESHKILLPGTEVTLLSNNDSSLLKFVDQFYQEHNKGASLLVLHTMGSHFHYEDRYPLEFREFTPTCFKKKFLSDMSHCQKEELNNSYDNSILYTDAFIKNVIDHLRDKNALVIYTSDHGESLGENGRFLHGTYNAEEQIAVPMIFWASDKYIKNYPQNFRNLNKLKDQAILHDHLFHSILGCSGIKSDIINNKLNLCH